MIARYLFIAVLVCMFIVLGCQETDNPVYGPDNPDPNPPGTPAAVLTAVTPNVGYLKEVVIITGSGFDTDPTGNLVQFGTGVGTVLTATATELSVELPALQGVTVNCRVAVTGALEWSNELPVTFNLAVEDIALGLNWPMGVESDDAGNTYIGSANDEVIYKIDPDGNQTVFADAPVWGALRWGPGGNLYVAAANESQILRISPDGSSVDVFVDDCGSVSDFDWAENGNLYIIRTWGEGIAMYKNGVVTELVSGDDLDPKSGRVFGNYLYVSTGWGEELKKYPITEDGLGDGETIIEDVVVGVEADVNGNIIYSLIDIFTIYSLGPDGSTEELFKDVLQDDEESVLRYIRYSGKSLYVVYPGWSGDGAGSVKKIYLGVDQAPNWGLALP